MDSCCCNTVQPAVVVGNIIIFGLIIFTVLLNALCLAEYKVILSFGPPRTYSLECVDGDLRKWPWSSFNQSSMRRMRCEERGVKGINSHSVGEVSTSPFRQSHKPSQLILGCDLNNFTTPTSQLKIATRLNILPA